MYSVFCINCIFFLRVPCKDGHIAGWHLLLLCSTGTGMALVTPPASSSLSDSRTLVLHHISSKFRHSKNHYLHYFQYLQQSTHNSSLSTSWPHTPVRWLLSAKPVPKTNAAKEDINLKNIYWSSFILELLKSSTMPTGIRLGSTASKDPYFFTNSGP